MIRFLALIALGISSGLVSFSAHAFELDCSFSAQPAEPLRLRFQWDPVPGKGSGELQLGREILPVRIGMVQSVWWGLGDDVLYTRVEFVLPDGTLGELRDFPAGSEPDSLSLTRYGKSVQASQMNACQL